MNLSNLLIGISVIRNPLPDIDISSIEYDSRKVSLGSIFVAIKGYEIDGRKYIKQAIAAGSIAVVVDDLNGIQEKYLEKCIYVKSSRKALAILSTNFFENPTSTMLTVGVTGTNGKSSTVQLIRSVLESNGHLVATLGTIECVHPGRRVVSDRTTLESKEIQEFIKDAKDHGCDAVVIEVSSHALSLDRVLGCNFNVAVFTNLSRDHEDFYQNMESYFNAKKKLFFEFGDNLLSIINLDDKHGERLFKELPAQRKQNSIGCTKLQFNDASFVQGHELRVSSQGIYGVVKTPKGDVIINSTLTGRFNVENILCAISVGIILEYDIKNIQKGINALKLIRGRLEKIESSLPFAVYIDFAHSGDALENALNTLREVCEKRLIVVFGAGGDKDPMRRVLMGKVAANLADLSVVTSDNPRSEDPKKIIEAIVESMKSTNTSAKYIMEPDRSKAIAIAINEAKSGDVVIISGKGHQQEQIVRNNRFFFCDRLEAEKFLEERSKNV